ncbi:hypothetical protein K474DRAFT_1655190 [Panus rudis PR-1116 ss-1]|nr:hypothetical protein K474DRAFT_1655190 [Panus rudis PR-1116 ss-1]
MYFTHWINLHLDRTQPHAHQITDTHARWMFALLSRVDDYLSADEMALLRNLARACMSLLKERLQRPPDDAGDDTSISESSCWMIITAVVGIWGQKDLWMDVESILSELE